MSFRGYHTYRRHVNCAPHVQSFCSALCMHSHLAAPASPRPASLFSFPSRPCQLNFLASFRNSPPESV
eukprot:3102081-Amphidinium_carterae.1